MCLVDPGILPLLCLSFCCPLIRKSHSDNILLYFLPSPPIRSFLSKEQNLQKKKYRCPVGICKDTQCHWWEERCKLRVHCSNHLMMGKYPKDGQCIWLVRLWRNRLFPVFSWDCRMIRPLRTGNGQFLQKKKRKNDLCVYPLTNNPTSKTPCQGEVVENLHAQMHKPTYCVIVCIRKKTGKSSSVHW